MSRDARAYRMIVATTLDGVPMGIGGLGRCGLYTTSDRLPAFKDKPLKERFGLCPWGLYFIDVRPLWEQRKQHGASRRIHTFKCMIHVH